MAHIREHYGSYQCLIRIKGHPTLTVISRLVGVPCSFFPTNERIEDTPPPNFETPVDLDLFKGLGSFLGIARKDYQK